jgi:hypothetical protein
VRSPSEKNNRTPKDPRRTFGELKKRDRLPSPLKALKLTDRKPCDPCDRLCLEEDGRSLPQNYTWISLVISPIMPKKKAENTDYDSPWKAIIELYFRDFLAFFFPHIEADIDWSKPIRFLDKELAKIMRDAEIPKRYADKLVEVHRLSGEKAIVICHIEVQNEGEAEFEARMYSYNYRLRVGEASRRESL